ncbi:hypothetical protein Naga_100586g2 [Nannochloropsis gaditana]|uniref:Uncharacterized protein n=1 Tax=Nannochloropsis gaditana TaxID=72520 RepID=W7TR73_9STRA|nr:hypothetical protein Naga_100586g2 [Nannochloropsis gaditana]
MCAERQDEGGFRGRGEVVDGRGRTDPVSLLPTHLGRCEALRRHITRKFGDSRRMGGGENVRRPRIRGGNGAKGIVDASSQAGEAVQHSARGRMCSVRKAALIPLPVWQIEGIMTRVPVSGIRHCISFHVQASGNGATSPQDSARNLGKRAPAPRAAYKIACRRSWAMRPMLTATSRRG